MYQLQTIEKIGTELEFISSGIKVMKRSRFGYRERINIERLLYLLIKLILKNEINFNISGFNIVAIKETLGYLKEDFGNQATFLGIIEKAFELKIYAKKISSSNAYVRSDALFATSPEGDTTLLSMSTQLMRLKIEIENYLCEKRKMSTLEV